MRKFDPDSLPYLNPKQIRRVCVITGGNSGIGWFTVLHLYLHGYVIYIAGRSRSRVSAAIEQISQEAVKRRSKLSERVLKTRWLGELKYLELDLLSLKSVDRAAKEFKAREKCLHLLINNAGIMAVPFEMTDDGFEIQMQTNFVSHFLLTQKMIPLMETQVDPRIIYLSSVGHSLMPLAVPMDSEFNYRPNMLFTWFRYGMSKTAGIHMIKCLSVRNPSVLSLAVHPGFVMNTNLFSHLTRLPILGVFFWFFFQFFGYVFGVTNETGSFSTIKCSLSPDITAEKDNGKYFATYGIEKSPSTVASSMACADATWAWATAELARRGYSI
ncbi:unnamed protein product [Kuraishia capsulata CBS 1993]|uniref:Ketoreductase (KR) domain-containing protein n=1 Tax=Kuraishia capsulata CBS 1993 TaxID=1382522 RepID=W6MJR4_9ASCO|nr:uncharacterized protein KUCA_T00000723001 [Kuraishia capsulata CBS 1993]CDK24757.1 unnamed protein product [Kuraishia capsulata CBS 1993]